MSEATGSRLVVGITSRALFDLTTEDRVFREEGLDAYRAYQRRREAVPLAPGTGFPLVRALLGINRRGRERLVEVVVISRNDADSGVRIFNSIAVHELDISRAAFTDGRPPWPYLRAFGCTLFLSAGSDDVEAAQRRRFPAALVSAPPHQLDADEPPEEVRIAFDGDAVLFDPSSEQVYQQDGLEAFQQREAALAHEPMQPGPFAPFLRALHHIQAQFGADDPPVRTALVTARGAPAHMRVINTLRHWGVRVDESYFLAGGDKTPVLREFRPHIFFDDQHTHLEGAAKIAPSAQVLPAGAEQMSLLGSSDDELLPPPVERVGAVQGRLDVEPSTPEADAEPGGFREAG